MSKDDGSNQRSQDVAKMATNAKGQLSDKMELAIEYQLTGAKFQDVAESAGISREQFWRWRHDPAYVARLEQRRAELHQGLTDGFWGGLVPAALQVVAESLAEGDPDMARDILRLAGPGLTDVKVRRSEGPTEGGEAA